MLSWIASGATLRNTGRSPCREQIIASVQCTIHVCIRACHEIFLFSGLLRIPTNKQGSPRVQSRLFGETESPGSDCIYLGSSGMPPYCTPMVTFFGSCPFKTCNIHARPRRPELIRGKRDKKGGGGGRGFVVRSDYKRRSSPQ